jgi:DNA-binding transcriptional LysR family regulator
MTKSKYSLHHYDLTDLRLLQAVADESSLQKGAQRCHLSSSSASLRIKKLEGAVGTQLLVREVRGVSLTQAGKVMVEHIRLCVAQLEQMHSDLQPFASGLLGHLTCFANNNAISSHLPEDLACFFKLYPTVRISLQEHMSMEILAAVAAGRADVGVVAASDGHPDLEFFPYREDRLVLLCPLRSPLSNKTHTSFSVCLNEPFISLQSGAALHAFLVNHAAALGSRLDVRVQVSGYRTIARLVAMGAGLGVVPISSLEPQDYQQLHVVELEEPWALRHLHVCALRTKRQSQVHIQNFIDVLCHREL